MKSVYVCVQVCACRLLYVLLEASSWWEIASVMGNREWRWETYHHPRTPRDGQCMSSSNDQHTTLVLHQHYMWTLFSWPLRGALHLYFPPVVLTTGPLDAVSAFSKLFNAISTYNVMRTQFWPPSLLGPRITDGNILGIFRVQEYSF